MTEGREIGHLPFLFPLSVYTLEEAQCQPFPIRESESGSGRMYRSETTGMWKDVSPVELWRVKPRWGAGTLLWLLGMAFLLTTFPTIGVSQSIQGRILDEETGRPVPRWPISA